MDLRRNKNTMIFRWSAICLVLSVCTSTAFGDTIFRLKGQPVADVTIQGATNSEIKYKLAGVRKAQTLSADEVESIEFTNVSAAVRKGIGNIETGDFAAAVQSLRAGSTLQEPSGHVAGYWLGVANLRWGGVEPKKLDDAVTAFEAFISKYEGDKKWNWFVPNAIEQAGQALIRKGDFSGAEKKFSALSKYSKNRWGTVASLAKGEALLAQKKYSDARNLVSKLTRSSSLSVELRSRAWVVYATCQFGDKQYSQAVTTLQRELITKLEGEQKFGHAKARAYLLWGDCELAAAGSDKSKLQWAKIRFLQAASIGGAEGDDLAEALYKAQDVYQKLGQTEQAEKLRTRLKTECGNSRWAKK